MGSLKQPFDPRTVALIGPSEREGSIGRTVLENLLQGKDRRKIFPVNPKAGTRLCHRHEHDIGIREGLAGSFLPCPVLLP